MSEVLVLGGAGELGSNFAKLCINRGYDVKIIDIVRKNEAWRLKWLDIFDKIDYVWKSTFDITTKDVNDIGIVLDCGCQPDRPLGTSSPIYTLIDNLLGPLRLLEAVLTTGQKPKIIYPSSCNVFLGVPKEQQPITEKTKPRPTNVYGWSKLSAEELYLTYRRTYNLPITIIRTGSCYGPGMRTDQMIAKCIIHLLNDKIFHFKSPYASRTYTYTEDVMDFYNRYLDNIDKKNFEIIHNGGNKENRAYSTLDVAEMIDRLITSGSILIDSEYEVGEEIESQPVIQWESYEYAEKEIGWKPKHTLEGGIKKTIKWFEEYPEEYVI